MKDFLVLFREADGRKANKHTQEEIQAHRENWAEWFAQWTKAGNLVGGNSLSLEGRMIKGDGDIITDQIHQVGTEIVGGFLLLKAESLEQATAIAASCPIYEFDGYAEIRGMQNQ
ncbi:YciI family protein [Chryseobacterium sp. Bi04]|uniref:YciI family protein n=1 Tax=Chryseobacterium sp. Bi04 TaxID=2822345 RepID=UPI001DA444E0|nr:YciI family protein [Chryseobacterium sp. Bi04]CAH0289718.1 hypothetical protein SRABI04_04304 [Chryseobacterium sp. Bi04]